MVRLYTLKLTSSLADMSVFQVASHTLMIGAAPPACVSLRLSPSALPTMAHRPATAMSVSCHIQARRGR